uniref:Uncharacterized protein n=1 Tax=Rhizophora mucronata TaxID=61149 RepID=A0A2P2KGD2_RHIMU
MNTKFRDDWG